MIPPWSNVLLRSLRSTPRCIAAQIMSENDLEQKAFAEFTLARCIIAAGEATRTSIQVSSILLHLSRRLLTDTLVRPPLTTPVMAQLPLAWE